MRADEMGHRFAFHALDTDTEDVIDYVRTNCRNLAYVLDDALPEGREKSLAITHLEEAMMWSSAAIARA